MTKKILFTLVLIMTSCALITVEAKDIISKGEKVINLGIGIGSYYGGTGYKSGLPPISVSYEQGIIDGLLDGKASIGVGGYMALSTNKWESSYPTPTGNVTYGYKYSYFVLGARGAFHYQLIDKLDTYAGLMLGYNIVGSKYYGYDLGAFTPSATGTSGLGYSGFIGARYQLTEKITAFAELGYGVSPLQLGVSFGL
jgi:hypothetical protein